MKKLKEKLHMCDRLQLLAVTLAQWWRPVASTKALNLLHQAMHVVLYPRTAVAIKMASKVGPLFHHFLFAVALAATRAIQRE
jgi:hypothetical protein